MSKPADLVQGTLDMLLLKILALEPMNGFAVSQRLSKSPVTFYRSATGPYIQLCTSWNRKGGSLLSGNRPRMADARNTIR
jgi:hypothetical protein